MTYLSIEKLNTIIDEHLQKNIKDYDVFIETGTFCGNTIFMMEPHFNKLHTIEISEKYFLDFEKNKNGLGKLKINNHLGDSVKIIPKLVKILDENDKCIFWLDGHWSSGDTGRGEKDCPLVEECRVIDATYKANEGIILIDDYRLFGTKINENWINITKENIKKSFKNFKIIKQFVLDDILILYIKK